MRHSFVLPNQKIETGKFDEKSLLAYVVVNGFVELFDSFVWCRCMHKYACVLCLGSLDRANETFLFSFLSSRKILRMS